MSVFLTAKTRKLTGAITSLLLLASLCVCPVAIADDNVAEYANTGNTTYHFNLGGNYSSTAATSGRLKENATPLFVWPDEGGISFDMCYIYGEGRRSGESSWSSGSTQTVGGYGIVYQSDAGVPLSLMTYINENQQEYARLTAWQCSQAGWMTGQWSPDSTKIYTYCNSGYH